MAMIDYGAIAKVDGKIINQNQTFMHAPEGAKETFNLHGREVPSDDFFACCGDKDFYICFYKTVIHVVKNNVCILSDYGTPFASETFYINNNLKITTSKIDPAQTPVYMEMPASSWKEYIKENWVGATGEESIHELHYGEERFKWWNKMLKAVGRNRKKPIYYNTCRKYFAEWDYNGHHYEVIYGYGIDSNIKVYKEVVEAGTYAYTEKEIEFINNWLGI